jgi:hypothetical protein
MYLILKDLKLSKFSDIWTIDKTHNKFLAHELKMRFKLLNFARKLFVMLLKRSPSSPWSGKFICTKMFVYTGCIKKKETFRNQAYC